MKRNIFSPNGSATELRNCLEEARMECWANNVKVDEEVKQALALGMVVVVEEFSWVCRSTDGVAGTGKHVAGIFGTHEDALKWLNDKYEAEGQSMEESRWVVLPEVNRFVDCGGEPITADEVPF